MNCPEVEGRLADYLGGEAKPEDRRPLEEHLSACAACRREVESLGGTLKALGDLPRVETGEAERRVSILEVRRRPTGWGALAWRTLPYAACLAVGLWVGRTGSTPAANSTGERPAATAPGGPGSEPHSSWVAAARGSIERPALAPPIPVSFALLAEISSRGNKAK